MPRQLYIQDKAAWAETTTANSRPAEHRQVLTLSTETLAVPQDNVVTSTARTKVAEEAEVEEQALAVAVVREVEVATDRTQEQDKLATRARALQRTQEAAVGLVVQAVQEPQAEAEERQETVELVRSRSTGTCEE